MFFASFNAHNRVSPADPAIGTFAVPGATSEQETMERAQAILERDYPYARGWTVEISISSQAYEWEKDKAPECPEGYYWNGRQCLKHDNVLRPTLYEREGF